MSEKVKRTISTQIYSCEVFNYLKNGYSVYYVNYLNDLIIDITNFSTKNVQDLIDDSDKQNDCKTYFYIKCDKLEDIND